MSAPHPAALPRNGVPSRTELHAWLIVQDELDVAAHRCRQACEAAGLHPALTAALVARAASPAVMRAAAERFRRWQRSLVLDPFGGSGTVGVVAEQAGRHATLIDLDERAVALTQKRTAQIGLLGVGAGQ